MKKLFAVTLAVTTLFSCSSKNENPKISEAPKAETIGISNETTPPVFRKTDVTLPDNLLSANEIIRLENGSFLVSGIDKNENPVCFFANEDLSEFEKFDLQIDGLKPQDRRFIAAFNDRIYAVALTVSNPEDDYSEWEYAALLYTYDSDGNKISSAEITAVNGEPDFNADEINGISCPFENILVLNLFGKTYLMNEKGEVYESPNPIRDKELSEIVRFSDGRIFGHFFNKYSEILQELKIENGSLLCGESIIELSKSGTFFSGDTFFKAYMTNGSGLYGLDETQKLVPLVNYVSCGISGISCPSSVGENKFAAICSGKPVFLSELSEEETAEMQEITLAVADNYQQFSDLISDFNASNSKYRVNIRDYSENYEYSSEGIDNAVKDLEIDIISGNIPDAVWLDYNEISKLSSKEAFADLYELIDADEKYSRDDFMPSFLSAAENNGHLYSISSNFIVKTLAAKSDFVSGRLDSVEKFADNFHSLPDGMGLFETANNCYAVLNFLSGDYVNFLDFKNHSCSFNSPEFINLLNFCNEFPSFENYIFEELSCRDSTAFTYELYGFSVKDICEQMKEHFGNADTEFIGFPTVSGNGSALILGKQLAVMYNSPHKEAAWELIRYILESETDDSDGIPVLKKQFESQLSAAQDKYPKALTDKVSEMILGSETAVSGYYSELIYSVINDETAKFFAGACTAEQCADMIQNRLSIMMSEMS